MKALTTTGPVTIEGGVFRQLIWTAVLLAVGGLALLSSFRAAPHFTPTSLNVTSTLMTNPGGATRYYGATSSATSVSQSTSSTSTSGIAGWSEGAPSAATEVFDTVAR